MEVNTLRRSNFESMSQSRRRITSTQFNNVLVRADCSKSALAVIRHVNGYFNSISQFYTVPMEKERFICDEALSYACMYG